MATLPLPKGPAERGAAAVAAGPDAASATWPLHVLWTTALAIAGTVLIWPTALQLWSLWTTDALKSIGALVPWVCLLLILRTWRALGWSARGTWWGLALLAGTAVVVALRQRMLLELVLGPTWALTLPPYSLVAFAYVSGVVLTAGGTRLWRAAWFPITLSLLVNPVPHVFSRWIDLPLQHAAALGARGVAHALGQKLTPDQLRLMFTPDFGMFIAPGCDGMRGAVTMGLLALVAGYLYRFRLRPWALVTAAAILLGYLFNFARLCVLVLYYLAALHVPALQPHAEGADYIIGASLFFAATLLLFSAVRRYSPGGDLHLPPPSIPAPSRLQSGAHGGPVAKVFALAAITLLFGVPLAWSAAHQRPAAASQPTIFPQQIAAFRREQVWTERLDTGQPIFAWARYRAPAGSVALGVSAVLGAHDVLLCHVARGEGWQWHGPLLLPTAAGPVAFSATYFNDGETAALEASTLCSAGQCGQYASTRKHVGLVYSHPGSEASFAPAAPVPVLLRVELPAAGLQPEQMRAALSQNLAVFAANTTFAAFSNSTSHP